MSVLLIVCEVGRNAGENPGEIRYCALITCHDSDNPCSADSDLIDILRRDLGLDHQRVGARHNLHDGFTIGDYAKGTFFEPTVFAAVSHKMRLACEEVFGPVVALIEFDTFEQGIEIANSIDYGLSSALYTKDLNRAFAAIRDLEAGITYINAPTIGAEVHLPFGGVKQTGNGHSEGNGAIDFFTTWKAVYVDYSDKLQRAQIDNAE